MNILKKMAIRSRTNILPNRVPVMPADIKPGQAAECGDEPR